MKKEKKTNLPTDKITCFLQERQNIFLFVIFDVDIKHGVDHHTFFSRDFRLFFKPKSKYKSRDPIDTNRIKRN